MKTVVNNTDTKGPSLTERMLAYEKCFTQHFTKRTPVIVRVDGRSFSGLTTNHFNRPFDPNFSALMQSTLEYLVDNVQGCVFAFSQSDEISLFLRDYDTLTTESFFGSNVQKIVSVTSALASVHFNAAAAKYNLPLAIFDSRAFILPKEEVVNYFIYRQHDGVRNSVQMLGQQVLGHKECQGKNNNIIKELLLQQGNDWNSIGSIFRHGVAKRKGDEVVNTSLGLFKDDRSYIEELVYVK